MLNIELSPGYAASIAPARIVTCVGATEVQVREMLAQGLLATRGIQSRMVRFGARRDEAGRAQLWNAGPEYVWFGFYDKAKFNSLNRVFDRIATILSSRRLDILCDLSDARYAWAAPGVWKIHFGKKWVNDTDREKRIQVFVHEAAHIAGRFVVFEDPWYGKSDAIDLAHKHRPFRPRMALRSAENIGYYATDFAETFLSFL